MIAEKVKFHILALEMDLIRVNFMLIVTRAVPYSGYSFPMKADSRLVNAFRGLHLEEVPHSNGSLKMITWNCRGV